MPRSTLRLAARKLSEETGVADVFLEQLYSFDNLGEGAAEVVVAYFALVDIARARLRGDLEWRPAWHPVRGLPALAFSNERVVAYAEERLRNKLEYTNVVYSLLPPRFTLTDMPEHLPQSRTAAGLLTRQYGPPQLPRVRSSHRTSQKHLDQSRHRDRSLPTHSN